MMGTRDWNRRWNHVTRVIFRKKLHRRLIKDMARAGFSPWRHFVYAWRHYDVILWCHSENFDDVIALFTVWTDTNKYSWTKHQLVLSFSLFMFCKLVIIPRHVIGPRMLMKALIGQQITKHFLLSLLHLRCENSLTKA